jgi:Zn-dependent peptidase ImmA (M78 family)
LREITGVVEADVELPATQLPAVDVPAQFGAITDEQIERAATEVRTYWRLGDGPIPSVVGLLEGMGCVVSAFAFGSDELSAFSQRAEDRPYVLLNSDEDACGRWRFNAAHELGHLVLHRAVSAAEAATPELHKLLENQAHRFASALLLPAESFSEEVYSLSLDALLHVKSRWRVSVQMMLRRSRTLELVTQDRYERAFRDLSRRGFRTREPLDDTLPIEPPQLLSRSIQMMLDEHATTRDALLHQLPYSHADVEVLAGLPRGYLSASSWGELAELKLRNVGAPMPSGAPGQLLPFKRPS